MKILITGHVGHIGKGIYSTLIDAGYEVIGYDITEGDNVLDYPNLLKKMQGCEQVIHLAGIPHPILKLPFKNYFDLNVVGTHNVMMAAEECKVKRVIFFSSFAYYGIDLDVIPVNGYDNPVKETDLPPSINWKPKYKEKDGMAFHYVQTKLICEAIVKYYGIKEICEVIIFRPPSFGCIFKGKYGVKAETVNHYVKKAVEYKNKIKLEPFNLCDQKEHMKKTEKWFGEK